MPVLRLATANLLHGMVLLPGRPDRGSDARDGSAGVPGGGSGSGRPGAGGAGPRGVAPGEPGTVDPAALLAAGRLLDADVVAVQEVDLGQPRSGSVDEVRLLADGLGAAHTVFAATVAGTPGEAWTPLVGAAARAAATGPQYGIGLVSRFPLTDVEVVDLGRAPVRVPLPRPDGRLMMVSDEPRAAVVATVDAPGGPVTVAATHLSFVPGVNVAQLRRLGVALAGRPGPRFVLGDLNMLSSATRLLRGYTSLARVPTYPSTRPRIQFDHVLAAGVDPRAVTEVRVVRLPVSDHAALRITLDRS